MKKILSILLLLFYANVVFGTHISCQYCEEKLVNAALKVGWETNDCQCLPDHQEMGCCKTEITSCKSDIHNVQNTSYNLPVLFADNTAPHFIQSAIWLGTPNTTSDGQLNYHYLIKGESSRQILSLIHTLRI